MSYPGANFPPPPDLTPHIARVNHQYVAGGGFGDVYRCWYHEGSPKKEVAVKAFRFTFPDGDASKTSTKMLRRELGVWRRLNHNNVVPFLGIAYGFGMQDTMSLVSLWMCNGSLHHFLNKHSSVLAIQHRLKLLVDIANGLGYLHSFPIVHGDLNCNNVLLDADCTARLTDFGYASLVGNIPEALTYLQRSTTRPGALRWSAPEQVDSEETFNRTTKSDVLSGKPPWSEIREDVAVVLRLAKGRKPGRPSSPVLNDSHWDFIQQCWSSIEERPAAETIIRIVGQFLEEYPVVRPLADILSGSSRADLRSEPSTSRMKGSSTHVTHSSVGHAFADSSLHPPITQQGVVPSATASSLETGSWGNHAQILADDEFDISSIPPIELGLPGRGDETLAPAPPGMEGSSTHVTHPSVGRTFTDLSPLHPPITQQGVIPSATALPLETGSWGNHAQMLADDEFDISSIPPIELGLPGCGDEILAPAPPRMEGSSTHVTHPSVGRTFADSSPLHSPIAQQGVVPPATASSLKSKYYSPLSREDARDTSEARATVIPMLNKGIHLPEKAEDIRIEHPANHLSVDVDVIFVGLSGIGKSSLINMIMGVPDGSAVAARVSNSAEPCTTSTTSYPVMLAGGLHCRLWDTRGINDVILSETSAFMSKLVERIRQLTSQQTRELRDTLRGLTRQAVPILAFCIDASKVDNPVQWQLFQRVYVEYCERKAIPMVAITRGRPGTTWEERCTDQLRQLDLGVDIPFYMVRVYRRTSSPEWTEDAEGLREFIAHLARR